MHAEFFLDTNILFYAASSARSEQSKRLKARELLAMEGGGLSVYSEDLNHGQIDAGVRVINPFAG